MLTKLNIGEANDIVLEGLKNDATGAYNNTATVTFQVRSSGTSPTAGSLIGSTYTMAYVASSNGNYRGTFPATASELLSEDTTYYIWITAANVTVRRLEVKASYRGTE